MKEFDCYRFISWPGCLIFHFFHRVLSDRGTEPLSKLKYLTTNHCSNIPTPIANSDFQKHTTIHILWSFNFSSILPCSTIQSLLRTSSQIIKPVSYWERIIWIEMHRLIPMIWPNMSSKKSFCFKMFLNAVNITFARCCWLFIMKC